MLPLFVIADSDIEDEDLNSVLEKLRRKQTKGNKLKKKTKTKPNLAADDPNISSDYEKRMTAFPSGSADSVVGCTCKTSDSKRCVSSKYSYSQTKATRKRKRSIKSDLESEVKKARCVSCDQSSPECPCVRRRQNGTCLCEVGQIPRALVANNGTDHSSRVVALDCEFVGVGLKKTSALGRCTIVDYSGTVLLDLYARPEEPITDYRTPWSGIRPRDLVSAIPFECARQIVGDILKDKIVVGHAVFNDFRVLRIRHPPECVRDTGSCKPIRDLALAAGSQGRSLKHLSKALLGRDIQTGEHCSSEDAVAALDLYKLVQSEWETMLVSRATKRCQETVQPETRSKSFPDTCYLGDEFWPSDLFAEPSV